jgi:hypothetical protein
MRVAIALCVFCLMTLFGPQAIAADTIKIEIVQATFIRQDASQARETCPIQCSAPR